MFLTPVPGRQQTSLRGSAWRIGHSVLCREESPITNTHLFLLNAVTLVLREDFSWFGFVSMSRLSGLFPPSDGFPHRGPHTSYTEAPGRGEAGNNDM